LAEVTHSVHIASTKIRADGGEQPSNITRAQSLVPGGPHCAKPDDQSGSASKTEHRHQDTGLRIRHRAPSQQETVVPSALFEALPDELIQVRPVLSVGYAWALLASGELEDVESRLQGAERWLETMADVRGGSECRSM
jgi:hypothetical protein